MDPVLDQDLDWIRRDTPLGMTIRSAIPAGFEVYGLLDIDDEARPTEDLLLSTLAPEPEEPLIAGWILRNGFVSEQGGEHLLYANWHYRCRRVTARELAGRPSAEPNGFPDLLFPDDHRWLVSTLWDDSWRSIGAGREDALAIEVLLPTFERIAPDTDMSTTGREVR